MTHRLYGVPRIRAVPQVRRGDALVRVGGLLDDDLLVAALAGAAAHADEPEEAGADGEGDADPEDGEHAGGPRGFDLVGVEHGAEDGDEGAVEGGGGRGRGDHEERLGLGQALAGCFSCV